MLVIFEASAVAILGATSPPSWRRLGARPRLLPAKRTVRLSPGVLGASGCHGVPLKPRRTAQTLRIHIYTYVYIYTYATPLDPKQLPNSILLQTCWLLSPQKVHDGVISCLNLVDSCLWGTEFGRFFGVPCICKYTHTYIYIHMYIYVDKYYLL